MTTTTDEALKPHTQTRTLIDLLLDPVAAFEGIRSAPRWGVAFLVLTLLTIGGALLGSPAQHSADAATLKSQFTSTNDYSEFTQAGRDALLAGAHNPPLWHDFGVGAIALAVGLSAALVSALATWLLAMLLGKKAPFRTVFSGFLHIAVISTGVSSLVAGAVTLSIGAENFTSYDAIDRSMPGLGMLLPMSGGWIGQALVAVTPFSIWSAGLAGALVYVFLGLSKSQAWLAAIVFLGLGVILQVCLSYV